LTLRILLISHTYTAPISHEKLAALADSVELTVLTPNYWLDALFRLETRHPRGGYSLHHLPVAFNGRILRHFYPPIGLARLIRHVQPDLVHVEQEPASHVLGQAALLKGWHGYRLVCFTWENLHRRWGLPGLEAFNLRRCDGIVAGNAGAAEVMRAKRYRRLLTVIPQLGVNPQVFRPRRAVELRQRLGLGPFVVGFVGRLVEEKGLPTLKAAFEQLSGVSLLLVGGGPLLDQLSHWAASAGAPIHLQPAVPHEQVSEYMAAMDVLVLPSHSTPKWKEQFGHVLIEAMAAGVPVIGSDSGAIPEVIGNAGIVVPEQNATALRRAIAELRDDEARRATLGRQGRERVLAHYTHERIAEATVDFWRQVLEAG
jgi:glycosyltransferase involved in cell wall biosynthesis